MPEAYARVDESLADFWDAYAAERGRLRYVVRHPARMRDAVQAMRRLPLLPVGLADVPEARFLVAASRSDRRGRGVLHRLCAAVMTLPDDVATYTEGRRMQTLRRKVRLADKEGVRIRAVHDPAERRALVERANAVERAHPDPTYRVDAPHNDDLLACSLWLLAEGPAGEPLLLAVLPVAGAWASLRYFRTQGSSDLHSLSRWSMTVAMVEAVHAAGARFILDPEHPGSQQPGVRHFQRMVGFRFVRLERARRA